MKKKEGRSLDWHLEVKPQKHHAIKASSQSLPIYTLSLHCPETDTGSADFNPHNPCSSPARAPQQFPRSPSGLRSSGPSPMAVKVYVV